MHLMSVRQPYKGYIQVHVEEQVDVERCEQSKELNTLPDTINKIKFHLVLTGTI